jgi:hypothetical protein
MTAPLRSRATTNGHVLWIVARDRRDLYDLLVRHLSNSPTDSIMLDRRQGERRQRATTVRAERRRRRTRRRPPDPAFAERGWMAVRRAPARMSAGARPPRSQAS